MPFEIPEREISLYHGTVIAHSSPAPSEGLHRTDFGQGYYVTSIPFQAEEWAKSIAYQRMPDGKESFYVYEYAFRRPGKGAEEIKIRLFPEYDKRWLDFIVSNRLAGPDAQDLPRDDLIIGGMADRLKDKPDGSRRMTLPGLLEKYQRGETDAQTVLSIIRPRKAMDQYCFRTEAAARLLRRVRGWQWTREKIFGEWRWIRRDAHV